MDHFLEMVAARQCANVLAAHRFRDVAAQQHGRDESDLIHVVALLPPPHPAPRNFGGYVKQVEGIGSDASASDLVRRNAAVAELEPVPLADKDVERCEITMQRLAAVQRVQRAQHARDLAADEALGLGTVLTQPRPEIAVLRVLHGEAVAHPTAIDFGKPVVHAKRSILAGEQLGEIGLAQPARDPVADLDAELRRRTGTDRRGEVDLTESSLPYEAIETVAPAGLRTVRGECRVPRGRRVTGRRNGPFGWSIGAALSCHARSPEGAGANAIATQPRRPLPQIVRHLMRQAVPTLTRDENELAAVMAFVRHEIREDMPDIERQI